MPVTDNAYNSDFRNYERPKEAPKVMTPMSESNLTEDVDQLLKNLASRELPKLPSDQSETTKWLIQPFRFALAPSDYRRWKDQINSLIGAQYNEEGTYIGHDRAATISYDKLLGEMDQNNVAFTSFSFEDTSLGGNEAINCRWAFNRDDDIIQPINAIGGQPWKGGLGRVYYEAYQANAQYLYITAGVPEFGYLADFYRKAIDMEAARDINGGGWSRGILSSVGTFIGSTLGAGLKLAITGPFLPIRYLKEAVDTIIGDRESITKYYDFKAAMPQYYRYANSILVHLCTNLGLYSAATPGRPLKYGQAGQTGNQRKQSATQAMANEKEADIQNANFPEFLRNGVSFYRILSKRDARSGALSSALTAEDPADAFLVASNNYYNSNMATPSNKESTSWFDEVKALFANFTARTRASMTGADRYICFRLDKSSETSESFSNSTGQSTIQQTLNGMVQQGKDLNFSVAGGKIADIPIVGAVLGGIKDMATSVASSFGITGVADAVLTGSGFFDIPEVWQSSTFSKSYSFSMKFRAPYGDNQTIMQAIYAPLSLLLPLVLPRSVGMNSYTSPFVVRAYSKGMFAIPLGMIDSLSIARGSSEFGWSISKLPMVVKVNFTIKDLSPLMHMALIGDSFWNEIFASNSNFQEYLLTLSGMGLQERTLFISSLTRRLESVCSMVRQTWGSPIVYGGTLLGNMKLCKLIGAFMPWSGAHPG